MIKYLSIHHTGGTQINKLESTQHLTVAQIDEYHKNRWPDFKSSLGFWCGYTIVILQDGTWVQTRLVGEEGAHTRTRNFDSSGILIMGNYSVGSADVVTYQQKKTYANICNAFLKGKEALELMGIQVLEGTKIDVSLSRILPHRLLDPDPHHTECYGTKLPNDWARQVVMSSQNPDGIDELKLTLMQELVRLYMKLLDLLRASAKPTLGAVERGCTGLIGN